MWQAVTKQVSCMLVPKQPLTHPQPFWLASAVIISLLFPACAVEGLQQTIEEKLCRPVLLQEKRA